MGCIMNIIQCGTCKHSHIITGKACEFQDCFVDKNHPQYTPIDNKDATIYDHTNDAVNHPAHYTSGPKCECGKTIECIQVTELLNFNCGNAIKYLWRADHKGKQLEDLKKSRWYIDREIKRLEKGDK